MCIRDRRRSIRVTHAHSRRTRPKGASSDDALEGRASDEELQQALACYREAAATPAAADEAPEEGHAD
eukprot:9290452-Alexandrium_andersonii.AAC.1